MRAQVLRSELRRIHDGACQHGPCPLITHRGEGREPDYFATYNYTEEWTVGGQTALLTFWSRPLHATINAFTAAGFRVLVVSEPAPAPDTPRELFPEGFADKSRFLCFLFFVLQAG